MAWAEDPLVPAVSVLAVMVPITILLELYRKVMILRIVHKFLYLKM